MQKNEFKIMYDLEDSYWWFLGRQYLLKEVLKRLIDANHNRINILDIGCGSGVTLKLLKEFGVVYGMDFAVEALEFVQQRSLTHIVRSDGDRAIPFKDNSFSIITCLDVLEHLDNEMILIQEMLRICKPGVHIIMTVPAFETLWSPHDMALNHKRRYTRNHMLKIMRGQKCVIKKASYFNIIAFCPILVIRKIKAYFFYRKPPKSDFFIPIPKWINTAMTLLFLFEIFCLRFINYPFGLSLVMILKKSGDGSRKGQ